MESFLRLGMFIGFFALFAILEIKFPRRQLQYSRTRRWTTNITLSALNTVLTRIVLPTAGAGAAVVASHQNLGLLNRLDLPAWLELIAFLLIFDLTIYFQHRLFHLVRPLWLLHRVHHTDPDYDLTTGNRFHPLSILLSGLIKISLVLLMGPAVIAVVIAEILLNITAMFNHSNIRIPQQADKWLRLFVVTPDMHRVHHSIDFTEHNHNFGFSFPWWDRIFGSYIDQPKASHETMSIGIEGFQDTNSTQLLSSLAQPLRKPASA